MGANSLRRYFKNLVERFKKAWILISLNILNVRWSFSGRSADDEVDVCQRGFTFIK